MSAPKIEIHVGKAIFYFDEGRHSFTDTDGERLPSVTSVTGIIDKSGPLLHWAAGLCANYLTERLDRGEPITAIDVEEAVKQHRVKKQEAADIGTQIHAWVSEWILHHHAAIPDDERVRNGIQAFLAYQEQHEVSWLESELHLASAEHRFGGICDALGMVGKKLVLFEFKSAKRLYPENFLQTAAYQIALEEMRGKKIASRTIIRFDKETGVPEWHEIPVNQNNADKSAFLACLNVKTRLAEIEKAIK